MFAGLYMFLWAKKKESYQVPDDVAKVTVNDVEKPLLSQLLYAVSLTPRCVSDVKM